MQLISFIYSLICCLVTQWQKALYPLHGWAFLLLWGSVTHVCPIPMNSAWVAVTEYMPSMNTWPSRVPTQTSYSIHICWIFILHLKFTNPKLETTLSWAFLLEGFGGHLGFAGWESSGIFLGAVNKESWGQWREYIVCHMVRRSDTPVPRALRDEPMQRQETRVRSVTWKSNNVNSELCLWLNIVADASMKCCIRPIGYNISSVPPHSR